LCPPPPYFVDTVVSRIYDYMEIVILFGFVSIFAISFPSSGLLPFCIIAWELEIVIDAVKKATGFRKALPRRAEDIGVWEDVMNVMAAIAIVSNTYLVIYLAKFDYSLQFSFSVPNQANAFWIVCGSALVLRWITLRFVPGLPYRVKIQLERRAFLSDKLITNRTDENFELTGGPGDKPSVSNWATILEKFFPKHKHVSRPGEPLFTVLKGEGGGETKLPPAMEGSIATEHVTFETKCMSDAV
jgi:hypothetical protein